MLISDKGIRLLKSFEGDHLEPYICPAGKWTVGVGHVLPQVGMNFLTLTFKDNKWTGGITKQASEELLRKDLGRFEKSVERLVTVPLTQNEFDALVSFTFNIGEGLAGLAGSTLLTKLNNGVAKRSCASEFLRWNKANGKVLEGLITRRIAEAALWLGYV